MNTADTPPARSKSDFRSRAVFAAFVWLGLAALLVAAWALRTLILVTFLAILLAIVLRFLGELIHRATGLRPHWGVLIVALVLVLLAVGSGLLLAPTIADQARQLVEKLPTAAKSLQERVGNIPWLASLWEQVSSGLSLPDPGDTVGKAGSIVGGI